jgi:hypothetical protein
MAVSGHWLLFLLLQANTELVANIGAFEKLGKRERP